MHLRHIRRKPAAIAAATLLAFGALAGTAAAVLTGSTGTSQLRMDNRGDTTEQNTSSIVWKELAGSQILVKAHDTNLVNARFTAESQCYNGAGAWCAVRIIAVDIATGTIIELDPVSGMDFAFDAVAPGAHDETGEAHAMERSRRLTLGKYWLRVQFAVSNPTTKFRLTNWHFAVETSAS
jgi:hypothetical protein